MNNAQAYIDSQTAKGLIDSLINEIRVASMDSESNIVTINATKHMAMLREIKGMIGPHCMEES